MEQDSAKRRLIQRRAAWVTGLLAVGVLAVSGFAFLQSNGTVTATVSAASTSAGEVYTSNPAAPPANFPTLWYCGTLTGSTGTASINSSCQAGTQTSGPVAPAWSAVVNSQGGVTGAGDVAIVDACDYNSGSSACNWTTSNTVLLTVGLGNVGQLANDYTYMNLPVEIYQWTGTAWALDTSLTSSAQYLTFTTGYLTFALPGGSYYEVVVPQGGSFYCTANTAADLEPAVSVQAVAEG